MPEKKAETGRIFWPLFLLVAALVIALPISSASPKAVRAQSGYETWETPVNLSQSGGTSNPVLIPDANGVLHVVWEDRHDGYVYRRFNGQAWEPAVVVQFPFGAIRIGAPSVNRLKFLAGTEGIIHMFWVDETDRLYYSHVISEDFVKPSAWNPPLPLAESAVNYSVVVDSQGALHLAYVRVLQTATLPAGIYYKRSVDNGVNWSQGSLIYSSAYFRNVPSANANIQIDSAGPANAPWVYLTWDNRLRKQVFLSISKNKGLTWDAPVEIDQPDTSSGSATPFNLHVSGLGNNALLVWQFGDPESSCTQLYRWSDDGGMTWSQSQPVIENMFGCPQEIKLIRAGDNLTFLAINLQEQIYLLAWNGKRWSEPQSEIILSSFIDEETFSPVYFRCRDYQYIAAEEGRLYVVGCDTGSGGDIWLTSRSIGSAQDWYPPDPIWIEPRSISSSRFTIQSPLVVADQANGMHVFWSQTDSGASNGDQSGGGTQTSINYAFWDGERWIIPGTALVSSAGRTVQPAATLDAEGRLLVVWNAIQSGELYFTWAGAARAMNPSEWAAPLLLPVQKPMGRSPDVLASPDGAIYVAYAIPLNEARGIYLTRSMDVGKTWSTPELVFDGAAAGWEMVDQPRLALTSDGKLHALWTKQTIPSGTGVLGLFYASSEDGGQTWSTAVEVIGKPVAWHRIVATQDDVLHRFWEENSDGSMLIWHDQSVDGGLSWNRPEIVSSFLGSAGLATLAVDGSGQIHLLLVLERGKMDFLLQHSVWNGAGWSAYESAELGRYEIESIYAVNASISSAGKLGVIFAGQRQGDEPDLPEQVLFYTERILDIPSAPVQGTPALPQQSTETATPTETPTPQPTPTLDLANLGPSRTSPGFIPINNEYAGVIFGAVLVGIVIAVFVSLRALIVKLKSRSLRS